MQRNSMCIFGLQPSITIFIVVWIKFGMKHKFSLIFQKCLIKSFACKICISYSINLTSQFFIRTLSFSFLCILTFTLTTHCLQMICHTKVCLMGHIVPFFWESFDNLRGEDHYVLGTILPYLESLCFFGYGVSTST